MATDYYVGGAGASDSNPGTASQPFATIQKAASVARAGDVVNIRAGVYRETVTPANSGSGGNPIVFQAEGNALVTISGANVADGGWSSHQGNIYKKSITLPTKGYSERITGNTTLVANQVFVNGKMMIDARWPNLPNSDDLFNRNDFRYAKTGVNWSNRSINDGAIPNISGGWTGGTIWANGWFISHSATITSHNGSQVNFNEDIQDKFRDYYYLTGRLGALDVEKEWHYDGSTLYLYAPGGGSPSNVEVKMRNWSFDLSNRSNITIRNISTFACAIMTNGNSPNIVIDGLKAKYISHSVTIAGNYLQHSHIDDTGIRLVGDNSRIENSVIEFSSDQGVVLGNNGIANNNLIHDISYCGAYPSAVYPMSGTNNHKITRNTIYRTGRSAVDMWHQLNMDISYNDISQYGCLNIDLGAIYGSVAGNLSGTRIHHNWIHDTSAKVEGMEGIQTGIYFDQASGPCTVDHNVMWNNGYADIYNQQNTKERNAGSSYFYNNTFASTAYKTYVSYVTSPADVMRNNINRADLNFNNGGGQSNILNVLLKGVNPNFVGSGQGGLAYQLRAGSPAIDKGVVINGITDGSVGTPDIGAYEYGGAAWTAGYTPKTVNNNPNTAPTVAITSPGNNSTYTAGSAIAINANAADANGTVSRVEFYYGNTKLGEDLGAPFSFNWTNAPAGTHSVTARATDNDGASTTSAPITIIVTGNSSPQIQLTSPTNNAQFTAGSAIAIAATATDNGGTVTKVEFFQGTTKLGEDTSGPFTFNWASVPAGTYSITAKATDNLNATASSTAITVTVTAANTPPTVVLTGPAANATFTSGAAIGISATATDNGSVSKVEFFQGTTKLGEDTSSPYSFNWTNAPVGKYTLTAKATDNQNASTTSAAISVTVVAANTPPKVAITSPTSSTSFTAGSTVTISATASDNGSVGKVEFFQGATKLGEDVSSPYSFSWTSVPVGNYSITAKATDNQGVVATSTAIAISVITANTPPAVAITSPAKNSSFLTGTAIDITAAATDNVSVSKVEFFQGTTKLGEDVSSPYTFSWTNAAVGTYSITAKATDNTNLTSTSTAITVKVTAEPVEPEPENAPIANAGNDMEVLLPQSSASLTGSATLDGELITPQYFWSQISGPNTAFMSDNTAAIVELTTLIEGTYIFELVVTADNGLTGSDEVIVTVGSSTDVAVQGNIPRFFTPNGDGQDDVWAWTEPDSFDVASVAVFSRSGQKVYETASYQNNWDGTVNGKLLQQGDYYYVVKRNGAPELRGAIQILY